MSKAQQNQSIENVVSVDVDHIQPGRFQPRRNLSETCLDELTSSIKSQGIIQPLLLREVEEDGRYELIAGERRWRAAQLAGLSAVPAIIKSFDDEKTAEVALIENLQREDLNPLDEALGYQRLADEFNLSHQAIAERVGKSRSFITNMLGLLTAPKEIQHLVEDSLLTVGHVKALRGLPSSTQTELAPKIINGSWNVRKTEASVRLLNTSPVTKHPKTSTDKIIPKTSNSKNDPPADILHLRDNLADFLGLSIGVEDNGSYSGKLSIEYNSFDDIEKILAAFIHIQRDTKIS